jgi:HSP20 family molecular chaperone IbpA
MSGDNLYHLPETIARDGLNMYNLPQIVRDGLNMVDGNYNTAFAANLGELLQYGSSGGQLWKPAIDLMEGPNNIVMHIYIPGVEKNSLSIDFISNYMVINGKREFPDFSALNENTLISRSQEVIYGSFERRIKLPLTVTNKESVVISMNNGVLNVLINKDVEFQNRLRINYTDITGE